MFRRVLGLRSPFTKRHYGALAGLLVMVALCAAALAFVVPSANAAPPTTKNPRVTHDNHHDVSQPLSTIPGAPTPAVGAPQEAGVPVKMPPLRKGPHNNLNAPVQTAVAAAAPAASNNFDGIGNGFSGPQGTFTVNSAPPDTNGMVGSHDYIQTVNSNFAIFNKDTARGAVGSVRYGPVAINTLWSGFGGLCQTDNDGDPTVVYDQLADRWVISQFAVTGANGGSTPYLQCVAVSQASDPTGSWYRYSFPYSSFNDYPKMSVWPDGYYETYNLFNGTTNAFLGAEACAFNRSAMLTGASATQQCFTTSTAYGGLLPSNLDGATQPPAGSPNYVLGIDTSTTLAFWKFHVDWSNTANTTFTGPSSIAVASYAQACSGGTCIPQANTTNQLDSLADRLMYRLSYRNFGNHESLVVDHSVTSGSSTGMRWYEIRSPNGTPTVYQQGTYAPDSSYRWMGSIAMDQSGDMGMGFSISSSTTRPGISYTGRLASDPLNSMAQGETSLIVGGGSQTGTLHRWGDYSAMTVDPADDCTFWYTTEYIPSDGSFNWKTRIGAFKFASCGGTPPANDFSISASPTSLTLAQNASGTSTISTATTSGTAQTVNLTVSGAPSGASASLSPTSVTSGGSSTLTVNAGTAAAGNYTLTVTGTGTSATHTTTVGLTVTAPGGGSGITNGGFETGTLSGWTSAGAASSAVSGQGHTGTYAAQVGSTSPTNGDSSIAQTFTAPAGANQLSFWYKVVCPDSVTYDWATATLADTTAGTTATVLAKTCTNSGTWVQNTSTITGGHSYTLTLVSHDDNYSTDPTYTYYDDVQTATVTTGGNVIANGGFETGSLSSWTAAGASNSAVSGQGHTGTYAARSGSTVATNGDSSVAQTFTAPTGGTQVSFWYKVVCPDTVTYDWATATLKDNTANTTATVLAKTCTNSGAWVQVTASITGGHSYTLTLVSHDDNYSGDPTYTYWDDVVTQ